MSNKNPDLFPLLAFAFCIQANSCKNCVYNPDKNDVAGQCLSHRLQADFIGLKHCPPYD
ncbi:MAG: hypothetical protein F6K56_07200 [Moorea sp. SIO3G5]|nr:hypothetical protein [Moorena sp. SIO3G5]